MNKTANKSAKEVSKQFFSKSNFISIAVASAVVLGFVNLHPLNASLAQQIATALITVDGLILGFSILGVTIVSERGFSITRMSAILKKNFREFIDELKEEEVSGAKKIKEKLASTAESAIFEIISVPSFLFQAMYFLLVSLLSALMLFGVSDDLITAYPIMLSVFSTVLVFSLLFLILGFHLTIKVLQNLTMKTNPKDLLKAFEEAIAEIGQDLKKIESPKSE
jgi:hypothetical protein